MQPNDLPLVCLPLELPAEAARTLIAFLYELTEALERHYASALLCEAHECAASSPPPVFLGVPEPDPPF